MIFREFLMTQFIKHYADVMSGIALGKTNTYETRDHDDAIQLIRPQNLAQNPLLFEAELKNLDTLIPTENLIKRIKIKHYLQPNDIVITARSTSYHVAMIKTLPDNAKIIMNNNLICLRPNPNIHSPEAILVYLNSNWFKEQIIQKEFPKMLNLNVNWIKEIRFALPNDQICEEIAQAAMAHRQLKTDLTTLGQKSDLLLEAKLFSQLLT